MDEIFGIYPIWYQKHDSLQGGPWLDVSGNIPFIHVYKLMGRTRDVFVYAIMNILTVITTIEMTNYSWHTDVVGH